MSHSCSERKIFHMIKFSLLCKFKHLSKLFHILFQNPPLLNLTIGTNMYPIGRLSINKSYHINEIFSRHANGAQSHEAFEQYSNLSSLIHMLSSSYEFDSNLNLELARISSYAQA